MRAAEHVLVIESVRQDGRVFRPSDWIERLSTMMATFGRDHRLHYSEQVYPCFINGTKVLMVDPQLKEQNPDAYRQILDFAQSNGLRMHEE